MERQVSVSSDPKVIHRAGSHVYVPRVASDKDARPSNKASKQAMSRVRSASSLLDDIIRHPDVSSKTLREKARDETDRQDVGDLVTFLRDRPPPPWNLMSTPEDDGRRSRWSKLPFRRNREPSPKLTRLPDSAVAGTTTGGHRHIAISIPREHEAGSTQYPVYSPTGPLHKNRVPASPVRTFVDGKGTVTVLRTVTEASNESSTRSRGTSTDLAMLPPKRTSSCTEKTRKGHKHQVSAASAWSVPESLKIVECESVSDSQPAQKHSPVPTHDPRTPLPRPPSPRRSPEESGPRITVVSNDPPRQQEVCAGAVGQDEKG